MSSLLLEIKVTHERCILELAYGQLDTDYI